MQSFLRASLPSFLVASLVISCSAVTEFDRSKIGAADGAEDASTDAARDAEPDASENCIGVDCSDLDGECVVGICSDGVCSGEPRPTGTACDDGMTCTENDVCDDSGQCAGTTRSCDDNLTCTNDSCDETGGCVNELAPGNCIVDGTCYADEASNPANDCQWCAAEVDGEAWTNRTLGTTCDDGLFCTDVDQCDGEGTCEGTTRDCSDANLCNIDACDEDADMCTHMVSTDNCTIDSTCFARGVANPSNSCQVCDPDSSTSDWTDLGDGDTCDDGNACTIGDTCNASATCVPGTLKTCDDTLSCTTDSCDPDNGQCDNELSTTKCLIGGVCYNDNQGRAGFPCQRCETGEPMQWSNRAVTTDCEDGDACTENDECNSTGVCVGGAAPDCEDGNDCTVNGCDPGSGCTTQNRAMGLGCDDENMCTMNDQCNGMGACGGDDVTCADDGDVCTIEMCDADLGCVTMNAGTEVDCDDGNMCTTGNKCDGAGACDAGSAVTCADDGDVCTIEMCDTDLGCVTMNAGTEVDCDDGNMCTTGNKCDGAGACDNGTDICPPDGGVDSGIDGGV